MKTAGTTVRKDVYGSKRQCSWGLIVHLLTTDVFSFNSQVSDSLSTRELKILKTLSIKNVEGPWK